MLRPDLLQIVGVMDVPIDERREAYRTLTDHAARGQITVDVMPLPLADVAAASEQQKRGAPAKLILTPYANQRLKKQLYQWNSASISSPSHPAT